MYKPKQFAEMLGVTVKTLQRWDNDGKLIANRTPTDRRFYTKEQYDSYLNNSKRTERDEEVAKSIQDRDSSE